MKAFPGIVVKRKTSKAAPAVALFVILLLILSCSREDALEKIRRSGEIRVLTRNNAHCYYTYRDRPMGFEYDLAKAFSNYLGVRLRVVATTWEGLLQGLAEGKGDLVAASMTITPSRAERVDFSDEYLSVQQKVILHARNQDIQSLEDLAGKTVHVRRNTSYEERLKELRKRGLNVNIRRYADTPTEELISMVAAKEIEVTIADANIAVLNRRYYPDIRIAFSIEERESLGWAVKKGEKALLEEINRFFKKIRDEGVFSEIYRKYYADVEIFDYLDLKKYHRRLETRLPAYKEIIQKAAREYNFDWRLIAAVIYQESHLDPKARSFTGVEGIMQLTQDTANDMGIEDRRDPTQSIMGGVKYLRKLYDQYEKAKDPDRMLIALASYNVGRGHILDAQKIARERNLDPNSWSALSQILPLLRYSKYYKKTTYGYARGTEPVRYVSRILTYYDILKREAIS